MNIEPLSAICGEISRQERIKPRYKDAIRVIRRKSNGDPLQVLFFSTTGTEKFEAIPTLMWGNTEGYFWKRMN